MNEVHHLTDGEKLLLYFKLPSGKVREDQNRLTPTSNLPTSNRKEQIEASTWIKSHLEEHGEVCLPKSDVYDEYRQYCEQHELRPLCNADFGKMMKQVFPDINTRRLGQRGQSRYFYGGLRKRLEHPPPTLPELEITSKDIEMDSSAIDTEIFKSSCQLICEWAEKLLETKFSCVQEMAEHLIQKTFVNTKSVAALTLIAAMQESGKHNIKNSSVFGGQTSSNGDKHRETNLLLARKLQQNKEIQKQKEKAQALRDELQQTNQAINIVTSGSKTLVTINKKSTTPSSNVGSVSVSSSASSKIPSSLSSPLPSQSPQKFQTPKKPVSPWQTQKVSDTKSQSKVKEPVQNKKLNEQNATQSSKNVLNNNATVEESSVKNVNEIRVTKDNKQVTNDAMKEQLYLNFKMEDATLVSAQSMETNDASNDNDTRVAVTPELAMDTEQMELSHVRKIDFDTFGENDSSPENEKVGTVSSIINISEDKLSKSAGCLNLKTMLEAKDDGKSICLNKSMGFLECSKNALFVNQSTVPGRSAFVPFSQVQSFGKKDNTNTSHSVAMAIPVIMPSAAPTSSSHTVSQSSGIAMITIPTDVNNSPVKNPNDFIQNETVFNLIPSSSLFKSHTSQPSDVMYPTSVTNSTLPLFSIPSQTKDSISVVTVSSVLSKMTSSECVASNAQNSHKQMRMKFTPIRPKASPSKSLPQKDQIPKTEVPAYDKDKRPVSAILKEKRAKEQAEAMAKSVRLPSIPLQPNISLSGAHLTTLQALQTGTSNTSSNEVVIIVNNQPMKVQQIIGQGSVLNNSTVVTKTSSNAVNSSLITTGSSPTTAQSSTCLSAAKNKMKLSCVSSDISLPDESDIKDTDINGSVSSDVKELSPLNEERGITPILQDEDTVLISDGDSDSNMNTNAWSADKTSSQASRMNNIMSPGSVDRMWLETPRKIQKLNITSPFQEECSFGRDTPIRISKPPDSCSSRPESACSYGRETPSGARKRKSSDFHPRCNIKRLNSTGEDADDLHNLSLVLSPDNDLHTVVNPRRTQSCTDELDKDAKVKRGQQRHNLHQLQLQKSNADSLLQGLQSPDIHSLEREALIESFPNSLYAMKPNHKLHKNQSSSVGVNAKSLRQSQQKLIRQQQYLDERVKNFLQTKSEVPEASELENKEPNSKEENKSGSTQASVGNNRNTTKSENLVVTDRGKPYQRPSSVATMSRNHPSDMETSELPNDVAEWINDIMEQRQKLNQSAMSEPDYRKEVNQKQERQSIIQKFSFDMEFETVQSPTNINSHTLNNKHPMDNLSKNPKQSMNDDNNFTVPKAPPVTNLRVKDSGRVSLDSPSTSHRCQSLPIFASPVQSPVSPMTLSTQVPRNLSNRATSMSPRGQISEASMGMLSPTNITNSSLRRKETREGMVVGGHTGIVHRESKQGTYLASIQHSLQKPVDNPNDPVSPLDTSLSQTPTTSVIPSSKAQVMFQHRSRESSLDIDDRFVSQTPFSDSGYHSSGPSPILNSTPVSAVDSSEHSQSSISGVNSMKHSVAESPITMVAGNTSPLSQHSLNRPQLLNQQVVSMASSQSNSFDANPNQLRSSIHSAFIPIQGSNNIRYVTPIKPLVTVPNSQDFNSVTDNISEICNIYTDTNQGIINSNITMVSPHSTDPPSYEVAIKQLKKASPPKSAVCVQHDVSSSCLSIEGQKSNDQTIQYATQQSATFSNIGNEHDIGRPYSQKLIELSRQTQGLENDQNNALSDGTLDANKDSLSLSNMFMLVDQSQQAPPTYEINQSDSNALELDEHGANTSFNFTAEQIIPSNIVSDSNNAFSERELSVNVDSGSMSIGNCPSDVLNIDPSYQSNQPFDLNNPNDICISRMHQVSPKLNSSEIQPVYKNSFQKGDITMLPRSRSQNDEVNMFPSNRAFDDTECANNSKNMLIAGKLNSPGYDLLCDGADTKIAETLNQNSQDVMDDIAFPWESFDEIGKDLGDFNMF
ncbi:hypothetical protein ACF0H5_024379 [Mactra antiquata]